MGLAHDHGGTAGRLSDLFPPASAAVTIRGRSDAEDSDEYEMGESERGRKPVFDVESGQTVQRVGTPMAPLAVHVQVHTTNDAPV